MARTPSTPVAARTADPRPETGAVCVFSDRSNRDADRRHTLKQARPIASGDLPAPAGTSILGLTIPFVLHGIFRYLYLVHQKRGSGSPAAPVPARQFVRKY